VRQDFFLKRSAPGPFHRLVYAPGEVIDLTGSSVVNNSNIPQPAQVVLRCFIEQTGSYGATHSFSQDYILYETTIPESQTVLLTNSKDFWQTCVPPVPPSYSGQYLNMDKSKRISACLRFAYTLEIRLVEWGTGFYCRTPILISAAPPYSHQLVEHRSMRSNPELTDQWSIFQYAVSGPMEIDMAPTSTGSADIKKLVEAKRLDPIWMGETRKYSEWMKSAKNRERLRMYSEGKPDAKLDLLFYRPVVNTFAGPSLLRSKSRMNADAQ
jgi:hypothetical protein